MTETDKALAIWKAKTEAEQVEWIAVEVMDWTHNKSCKNPMFNDHGKKIEEWDFCPLTNWNDFRLVEIKIMEDLELWEEMMEQNYQLTNKRSFDVFSYWKTPLPKRCEALYLAYTSLHPTL